MKKREIICEVIASLAGVAYIILRVISTAYSKNLDAFCVLTSGIAVIGYIISFALFTPRNWSKLGLIGLWGIALILSVILICQ